MDNFNIEFIDKKKQSREDAMSPTFGEVWHYNDDLINDDSDEGEYRQQKK